MWNKTITSGEILDIGTGGWIEGSDRGHPAMRSENIDSNLTAKVHNSSYTALPAIVEAF
jgi:hypothetical protein